MPGFGGLFRLVCAAVIAGMVCSSSPAQVRVGGVAVQAQTGDASAALRFEVEGLSPAETGGRSAVWVFAKFAHP
ncbi:MAG: hypothetical protein AAFY46_06565, partial [Planctomycetota bacterium]